MGSAAEKLESVAIRRRPDKALRRNNRPCNLAAYKLPAIPGKAPTIPQAADGKTLDSSGTETSNQCVKFSAQPSEQVAANSNSSVKLPEFLQGHASKNQLTLVVISCLSLGAILGYHWSLSINHKPVLLAPELPTEDPAGAEQVYIQPRNSALTSEPVVTSQAKTRPVATSNANNLAELEAKHLEEVEWLNNQNNSLKLQVDVLNQESVDLNRELLRLELQVTALQQLSEPSTETRIVYNYVNVPIGDGTTGTRNFTLRSEPVVTLGNTENDADVPDTSNLPELTLNAPEPDDDSLTDEQYMDEYSQTDEEYLNENLPDDTSDQELRVLYNSGNMVDRELGYDPETGFYINERYVGDEEEFSSDGDQPIVHPPIAN